MPGQTPAGGETRCPSCMRTDNTHRHGSISLPPAPQSVAGIINSLGGCETRQPEAEAQSCWRGKDAQVVGALPSAQAETQTPPPTQKYPHVHSPSPLHPPKGQEAPCVSRKTISTCHSAYSDIHVSLLPQVHETTLTQPLWQLPPSPPNRGSVEWTPLEQPGIA